MDLYTLVIITLLTAYPNVKYDQRIDRVEHLTYEQCTIQKDKMFEEATMKNSNVILKCVVES